MAAITDRPRGCFMFPSHSYRPPPPSRVTYTHIPRSALSGSIPLSCPVTANPHRSAPHSQLSLLIRQAYGQLTMIV
jgi:hypothetical protein